MTQLTLADAFEARDQALQRVEENAEPVWLDLALEAVRTTCLTLPEFHVDRVWEVTDLDAGREARALGPVFLKAKRLGWIRASGRFAPSVRSHGSPKRIWTSLLYEDRVAA